jgi:hypothetical protein
MRSLVGAIQSNMKGMSMSIKATEQPTFPFLFAARNFAASTHTEHLVLFYLISRLKDGTCFPKQTLIAHELRYTVRAIQDNIASLEEKGVITTERRGKNNVYRLHLDAIKKHQRPAMPETPEYMEPPTTKNLSANGHRLGRQANPPSPIEDSEQVNPPSPISGTGEPRFQNRRTQVPSKKTEKKTFKEKKTSYVSTLSTRTPDESEVSSFSESQGTRVRMNPILPTGMPTKPQTSLERAKKILDTYAGVIDLNEPVICADCSRIGKVVDGRCTFRDDDGTVCNGTRLMNGLEWLNTIRDQWDEYNKQVRESLGLPLKDTVGILRVDSMERQEAMKKCRRVATPMTVETRRHWAQQMFDTGSYLKVRKAWFLYATGMLDGDDEPEPEPGVTKLFAALEALKSRDGETK